MDIQHLPIIDFEQGLRLAGQQQALADDMLKLIIQQLPGEISTIKQSYTAKNYSELLTSIHKLHGAVCYTGLPRIKTLLAHLETQIKSNIMDDLPSLLNQLDNEVTLLLESYSRHQS